jgi:hypothetical protein
MKIAKTQAVTLRIVVLLTDPPDGVFRTPMGCC